MVPTGNQSSIPTGTAVFVRDNREFVLTEYVLTRVLLYNSPKWVFTVNSESANRLLIENYSEECDEITNVVSKEVFNSPVAIMHEF